VSRAGLLGACYGAMHGGPVVDAGVNSLGVPESWVALLDDGASIVESARELVNLRAHLS